MRFQRYSHPLGVPPGRSWPKISIVTPSFNQGFFLEKTIISVLQQGYPNLEYFIIDGGSTDNSIEIIQKYQKYLAWWVSEKDRGQSHAINKGFAKATGELLGWLNSDDYFLPNAFFKLAGAYLENPSVGAVYGRGHIVNQKGRVVYTPDHRQVTYDSLFAWSYGNNFMQPSCLVASKAWNECGPLDESLHFAMDLDLYLKIAKKFEFKRIVSVLTHSVGHGKAKTASLATRNLMFVDMAICYMKHGRVDAARRLLEDQAKSLSEKEVLIRYMDSHFFLKMILSFVKRKIGRDKFSLTQWD